MKTLLTLVLFFTFSLVAKELKIGMGPYFQTQPYKGASAIVVPSPVIFYDNSIIYVRWTRFGLYFYGHKAQKEAGETYSWGFSLTAQPRPNGYKPSDSNALNGLNEKKTSIEGGLSFTLYGDNKYIEAMLVTDLLNRYDSYIAKIEAGFKKKFGNFTFYPSIVGVYESKKFTDYYYGITPQEAARTNYNVYEPSGGLRIGAQTYISYPLYKKWSIFFNIKVDRLTSNAKNSPIVSESFIYSGLASVIYTFDF